jgi:hypothetical protein
MVPGGTRRRSREHDHDLGAPKDGQVMITEFTAAQLGVIMSWVCT